MATSKQVTSIQTRMRNAVKRDQACPNYVFKYQRMHIPLHVPLEFELDFDKPFITVAIQLVGTFYITQRIHSETIQALSVIKNPKKSTWLNFELSQLQKW